VTALLILLVVIAFGVIAAGRGGGMDSSFAMTAIRASGWIALVRVGLYVAAMGLFVGHADWRQIAGYVLLLVNSAVELAIVSALVGRPAPAGASVAVGGLIVVTSAVLGLAWAWIRR
jgi:hypothetical protein